MEKTKFENLKVENTPTDKIKPDPNQPRRTMAEIRALADDIKEHGLHHNIGIDASGMIVFGERRWRAVKSLGWKTIPAKKYPSELIEQERIEIQLSENSAREDVPIIEKANSWMRYIWVNVKNNPKLIEKVKQERNGMDVSKMDNCTGAVQLGYFQGSEIGIRKLAEIENVGVMTISDTLKLLSCPRPIQEALNAGVIKQSYVVEVMAIKDDRRRLEVLNRLLNESQQIHTEVQRINKEYETKMKALEEEQKRKEAEKIALAEKRQEQIRLYEKMRLEAESKKKVEEAKRFAEQKKEQERKDKEEQEAKAKEIREIEKQKTEVRQTKQTESKKVAEQKEITQSGQELRDIAKVMNNEKISDKVKEALEKGLIKPSQIDGSFSAIDETGQRIALGEIISQNKDYSKTITKLAHEKFLRGMNYEKIRKQIDENTKIANAAHEALQEYLPKATCLLYKMNKETITRLSELHQTEDKSTISQKVVHDLLPYLSRLDKKYKYSVEKEEKDEEEE